MFWVIWRVARSVVIRDLADRQNFTPVRAAGAGLLVWYGLALQRDL